jgi:arabinosaccharide transport system substrate-binding protein
MEEKNMQRTLTRRKFLKVGGGASLAALLASCQIQTRSPDAGGEGGSGGGGNALEFWSFSPDRAGFAKAVTELDAWKSAHPDVQVNFRIFPFEQMHDKLLTALVSGQGAPDIADIEISKFGLFIKGDRIPLVGLKDRIGGEIDNIYKPAATDPWSWQDEIYGVGNELNTVVLAYRRDVMKDAGVELPFKTWDDVIAAGHKVSQGERKMFAIHDLSFGDWYMLTQHAGTSFFDQNGDYNGDDPRSVKAMQFNHDLVYEHEIAGIAPAEANDNWFPPQYLAAFAAGRFVATWGPPWHLAAFIDQVPDQKGKWEVQKLPEGLGESRPTANYGGTGQCITEQCERVDVAWDLIRTANLTKEGVLTDFKRRTIYPAYSPAYDDPLLSQPNEYFNGAKLGQIYAEVAPALPATYQSPVFPDASEAVEREVITPVMNDEADAKTALNEVRTTIEDMQE